MTAVGHGWRRTPTTTPLPAATCPCCRRSSMPERRLPRPQVLRNASLLAWTALRHLADDPLLLTVQSARRLPTRWRAPLARVVGLGASRRYRTVRHALAELVADRPTRAITALEEANPRTRLGRRLAAELAVHLGRPLPDSAPSGARAREAWSQGDITGAIAAAGSQRPGGVYAARLASERRTMEAGFRLAAPRSHGTPSHDTGTSRTAHPRVLHVLTNSLPHTQSGYAIRSHEILKAQRSAGVEAVALTRIGYPVAVGLARARTMDLVDGVPYRRLLPARLASRPDTRLQQMVNL